MASTTKFAFTTAPLRMSLSPGKVSMQLTNNDTEQAVCFQHNEKKKCFHLRLGWRGGVVACAYFFETLRNI